MTDSGKPGVLPSGKQGTDSIARVWGLTGGVASGKSRAARFFSEAGIAVLDADEIAHELSQLVHAVFEDPSQVPPHDEEIHRPTAGHGVADPIVNLGAAVALREFVLVDPSPVGPVELFVDESPGRIPIGDFRAPAERQAA